MIIEYYDFHKRKKFLTILVEPFHVPQFRLTNETLLIAEFILIHRLFCSKFMLKFRDYSLPSFYICMKYSRVE
jgi:hypothetical protein